MTAVKYLAFNIKSYSNLYRIHNDSEVRQKRINITCYVEWKSIYQSFKLSWNEFAQVQAQNKMKQLIIGLNTLEISENSKHLTCYMLNPFKTNWSATCNVARSYRLLGKCFASLNTPRFKIEAILLGNQ